MLLIRPASSVYLINRTLSSLGVGGMGGGEGSPEPCFSGTPSKAKLQDVLVQAVAYLSNFAGSSNPINIIMKCFMFIYGLRKRGGYSIYNLLRGLVIRFPF